MPENLGGSAADLIADPYVCHNGLWLRAGVTGAAQDDPLGRAFPAGAPTPVRPFHLGVTGDNGPLPVTSGLGANVTSVTPVAGSNDCAGQLTVVTSGVLAIGTTICTVTFGLAYQAPPWQVDVAPADATSAAAQATGAIQVVAFNLLAASFQLVNRVAGAGAATYVLSYNVMGNGV